MQHALHSSREQTYLDRRDLNDIIGIKNTYHAVYNPTLFTQLSLYRSNLDKEYFALRKAVKIKNSLKARKLFLQFNDTLSRYLNKNRVELYEYLGCLYDNDTEKKITIEINKVAMKTAIDSISKTLVNYASPNAIYDEKFDRELRSIWKILKWRYLQELKQLYPLYPSMLETA